MKHLTKTTKPQILVENEDSWTALYLEARNNGTEKQNERWRHHEIRSALQSETGGKCAYCEVEIGDVAYPHVEHIIPKPVHPELAHIWLNLTSACPRCNTNKSDYHHETLALLNPYADDPGTFIDIIGGLIRPKLGEPRGEITVKQLQLNRIDLTLSRSDRLEKVHEMLQRWNDADEPLRAILAAGIRKDADEGQFTATVTTYLRYYNFPLDEPSD